MHLAQRDHVRWTGGLLRFTPVILVSIVIVSIITLALSVVHFQHWHTGRVQELYLRYKPFQGPSTKRLFMYCSFVPIISLLHSSVDLCLFFTARLAPLYALLGSLLLLLGWLVQLGFLLGCETVGELSEGVSDFCPTISLYARYSRAREPIRTALSCFEAVAVLAYLVYMSLAATAVSRARRASRKGHVLAGGDEEYPLT